MESGNKSTKSNSTSIEKKSTNTIREEKALKLLEQYRQGDNKAFTTLYNMYAVSLLNYGMCLSNDKELVKDCVHDVFVKLFTKGKTQEIGKVGGYLIISLRNRLLDEFRRDCFVSDTPVNDFTLRRYDESAETTYINNEHQTRLHADVLKLLNELTPRQQQAFRLYFIEQRKYDEICDMLQMNYACVRNLVHRGMVKLRASETYRNIKAVAM